MIMNFFNWDLGFVLPMHYIEMIMANGALFECEDIAGNFKTKFTAKKISEKCYSILNDLIRHKTCFKNEGFSSNQVASVIVYMARKEVLSLNKAKQIWPKEL